MKKAPLFVAALGCVALWAGPAAATATATLTTATPAVAIAPGHLGTATLSWSSAGTPTTEVWVSMDGLPESLLASAPSGSASPSWIQAGHDYQFTVYAGSQHTIALASTWVLGVAVGGGNVAATPQAVTAPAGGTGGAVITWATDHQPTAEVWVSTDGGAERLFARAAAGSQAAPWIQPNHAYRFALYAGTAHAVALDAVQVYGDLDYKVGVDYHATSSDFVHSAFVTGYHLPGVRDMVRAQLQGMADRGAALLHTRLWMVTSPGASDFGEAWRAHFPLSSQEATNLRTYAQDVAAVQAADGHRLRLDLTLLWLGAADYQRGAPATGLGYDNLSAAEFAARVQQTIASTLAAVSDVYRPDGRRLVETVYLDGEVMIGAKTNQEWFLQTLYPGFVQKVREAGLSPSLYFLADGNEDNVLDDHFVDGTYPILSGHRSMFWIYRSLRFLHDNALALPQRIDFSCYPVKKTASYATLVQRIFDDADATLPSLGLVRRYGAAETLYPVAPSDRIALGRAFAAQRLLGGRLERVEFWTSPDGGGTGVDVGYPFAVEDYLP